MQSALFETTEIFNRFLPIIKEVSSNPKINEWDIPYTIKQISYLTHDHYRYYGKFPSSIAAQLINQYKPSNPKDYIYDNFCGSGTTLVEAKLRGITSYGLDISWISALVSNVKSNHFNLKKIEKLINETDSIYSITSELPSEFDLRFAQKWFTDQAISDLNKIRVWLTENLHLPEIDFFVVAYLAIIRRVSNAYDAEVRPHVNAEKKQRKVIDAFHKKLNDMLHSQTEFQSLASKDTIAKCLIGNNLKTPSLPNDGGCYLAISHPPYLNSFNYRPVFSLEFFWGSFFEEKYSQSSDTNLIQAELIAHPANEKNTENYFRHLQECYNSIFEIQRKKAKLAVVIGDCTRNKVLIPVIDEVINRNKEIGYKVLEINYRTTHYGLGKYAYKDRADYHGNAEKRDAIIVFEK